MLKDKQEFIDYCVAACQNRTFVIAKHDPSRISTSYSCDRSVNCMGEDEMEQYLQAGRFRVCVYSDSDPNHSPEFYTVLPDDQQVVPGSGVPAYSTTPTTQCDIFAVPTGYRKGWHCYAYESSGVAARVAEGKLTLLAELL